MSTTKRELENLFIPILRNCKSFKGLKSLHANIVKLSLSQSNFLVTKMIEVCDNLGDSNYSDLLFRQVAERNAFLYNAMIRVHARSDSYGSALILYREMLRERHVSPDIFTFPFVLKSCAGLVNASLGSQIHGQVVKLGQKSHYMIQNGLINVYVKCGGLLLSEAHKVFDEMRERDLACWNNLLSGYAREGKIESARALFEAMPEKSIVSWTAMISGYTALGRPSEALEIFRKMQGIGIEPDEVSLVTVLPACAHLGALEIGKWIHFYADKKGFSRLNRVSNALIEMYAKCGCIERSSQLFERMSNRDVISWTTMISGLANHGRAREAITMFRAMERSNEVEPNRVTFLGVLSACVHAGFREEGLELFESMKRDHNLEPGIEHYGCLIDLLGRSGRLTQALETIEKMPMKPDSKIWGLLMNSCWLHRNLEIGIVAVERLLKLSPDDMGNYVVLSNIYADIGMWDRVREIRGVIRTKSLKKNPGCSSIEVNGTVQEFLSGDVSRPYSEYIFSMLELLVSDQNLSTKDLIDIIPQECSVV